LNPVVNEGVYVYAVVPPEAALPSMTVLATFHEAEGTTIVARESEVLRANLPVLFRAAWITLEVQSDLHSVGLTSAFANVLAEAGISCNVIAAAHHDHIFVPVELATAALACLKALQDAASR
jgi:hypothetical protein